MIKQVVLDVVNGGGNGMGVDEVLTLAAKAVRHCGARLERHTNGAGNNHANGGLTLKFWLVFVKSGF